MNATKTVSPPQATTLPDAGPRARALQGFLLVAASVLLPAAAHLAGLPVRQLLPMHWPVLLAGLVYGARAGALVGFAAPTLSHLVSGMPRLAILPAMTVELATYGLLAGIFREKLRWNPFLATAAAVAGGRTVFLATALATGAAQPTLGEYAATALLPGLAAAAGQVALLPLVARAWVGERGGSSVAK